MTCFINPTHNFINTSFLSFIRSCFFEGIYIILELFISIYITRYIYLDGICSGIIKCVPLPFLSSPPFSLPFCPSFFDLRPSFLQPYGDLLAQSMIPGFPGISITRPCKLSDAAIRRRAAGDETPLEILTIAAGRSVSRGAHGLSH